MTYTKVKTTPAVTTSSKLVKFQSTCLDFQWQLSSHCLINPWQGWYYHERNRRKKLTWRSWIVPWWDDVGKNRHVYVYIYTLALVLDQTQIFVHQNRTLNILHQKIPNFKPCFARNRVAAIVLTPKSRTLNPYSFTLPNLNPPESQNLEKTRTGFNTSLSCAFHTYYMIWTVHLLWILTRCQGCDTKPQPQWFWLTW